MQCAIVGSKIYKRAAFAAYYLVQHSVVVALVFASHNQHYGSLHGLHGYVAGINISGLGIIDVGHSVFHGYALQPVLYARETDEALAYDLLVDAETLGRKVCCESIALIVYTYLRKTQAEFYEVAIVKWL